MELRYPTGRAVRTILVAGLVAVLSVGALGGAWSFAIDGERWVLGVVATVVLGGVAGFAVSTAASVWSRWGGADGGVALAVDEAGVVLGGVGRIGWHEITGVTVVAARRTPGVADSPSRTLGGRGPFVAVLVRDPATVVGRRPHARRMQLPHTVDGGRGFVGLVVRGVSAAEHAWASDALADAARRRGIAVDVRA